MFWLGYGYPGTYKKLPAEGMFHIHSFCEILATPNPEVDPSGKSLIKKITLLD
jgi:hypothetical protein